jgi:hypothetical protein
MLPDNEHDVIDPWSRQDALPLRRTRRKSRSATRRRGLARTHGHDRLIGVTGRTTGAGLLPTYFQYSGHQTPVSICGADAAAAAICGLPGLTCTRRGGALARAPIAAGFAVYARRLKHLSKERFMTTLRVVCFLSALVCVTAQAQTCSGGPAGGSDATGNQCSAPGYDVDSALPTAVLDRPVAAIAKQAPAKVTLTGSRSIATTARGPQFVVVDQPMNRFPANAGPAAELTRTAKMGAAQQAPCSGGVDGGMDATGNQCNAVDSAGGIVVAHARGW